MKITLKLNIGNYQSIDFESNECNIGSFDEQLLTIYQEIGEFLEGWVDYTENAVKINRNIEDEILALRNAINYFKKKEE